MNRDIKEVALLFTKLGIVGFGGPAVHIALMQEEVVKKRAWMTEEHFLDLVGATNLIPGPNSTELTMHIGHERAGWKGLVVAGACFILPAVIITAFFAWLYQQYGQLPQVQPFIYGIKPAIIAVIVALMIGLGKKALKSIELGVLGVAAAAAVLVGANEILVLFGGGVLGMLLYWLKSSGKTANGFFPFVLVQSQSPKLLSDAGLFFTFLKIGSILYGSGYVLFAFLDAELVSKGLLTKQQLTDAIAVGQFTPGPVFSSATFVGWQLGGASGAVAATVGIFLPSFLFVALLNPLIPFLRRSKIMSAFLDAVNVVSIAIILSMVVEIGRVTLLDWRTVLIAGISFAVTFYFKKLNTAIFIFGGALLGYILSRM
ncbi:chromate efflux transporter [Paracnuella aquatica]|uniref:chromate efflux transporter n=1 Tax=Paracnuella aquatica TaxID=2268757 RepID=UPI000DF008EC|nr:chromate efflux transporter [Paracnuella aquatica]RPD44027.1 chromate efflux transporter [Paracnuella aquatica]